MIQELLVLLACTQNDGCSQTTHAYYISHPEISQTIKDHKVKIKEFVGPELVVLSPFILFAIKGSGTFKLTKHVSVQVSDKDANILLFKHDF